MIPIARPDRPPPGQVPVTAGRPSTMRSVAALAGAMLAAAVCTAASPRAAAADIEVRMAGMAFAPATVRARKGDRLVFVNDDGTDHVVLVPTKGFSVDLGTQKPGETRDLPLVRTGAFDVDCVVHPHMTMRVEVRP